MHIRAGAKGSVGFVIFKEKLLLETLDLQTSRVSEAKSLPRMTAPGQTEKESLADKDRAELGRRHDDGRSE
jgi:hypothetical protein